ncbi:heavy metal translocating P-type ATPase [Rhizobium favelukesii]|uniref:P-type Zn(2+) transporter n=1 Tax=Rhizobium favelukesii TaxID=348824 RepID=W6RHL0_9HYPH|nr:heavy metal translocating P-type ATPase [Rhizobium favelukesii]MCS0463070.1 cadmium-translocating P-type ATPase [Rhizobium favelukesii]CDM59875.1 putative heavy metal translocating P-type ATPase [Rhizobium favelukesii]
MAASSALKMKIEGMDCAACAIKIENAMKRLPGVSDINVSYSQESMAIMLDEDRTSPRTVEEKIKALGFTPFVANPDAGATRKLPEYSDQAWWKGKKGRLVIFTGLMFAVAWIIAHLIPDWGQAAYSIAALIAIVPFARRAIAGATSGTPFSIETLMSVAAIGALLIGAAEESAVVILLFAVGELLETIAAGRARAGIKALIDLVPRSALRERDGVVEKVAVEELMIDNVVVVRPGDRVPSDGKVIQGFFEVNEAPVTGESVPVAKDVGANVYAGSINTNGELRVAISHVAADNTISRIIHMVEEAQASKAPMARLIDRFSAWYTPAAMVVAALVIVVPPVFFGGDWTTWIYRGLSTLLIACPCALVISTPAAIASGLAAGARRGLLIKGGAALETLGKVKTIAFDKTGTLTRGRPQVTDVIPLVGTENDVLARAAAVERNTSHPLGVAIGEAAIARDLTVPASFGGAKATPGKAVTARLKNGFVSVGSPRYAAEQTSIEENVSDRIAAMEAEGKTVVVLMTGKVIEGLIALRDEPRDDAAPALRRLREMGVATVMLTGDNQRTANAIGSTLGIDIKAELLPDAKLAEIARLKEQGPVAMIGDGINDAPALATASIGVAMGGGTDVALETADAALLRDRVMGVADLIALSKATLGNIWQNIGLALGLKAIFLGTTLFGVTTLWMAILADTGATVLVTANALRLLSHGRRDAK